MYVCTYACMQAFLDPVYVCMHVDAYVQLLTVRSRTMQSFAKQRMFRYLFIWGSISVVLNYL